MVKMNFTEHGITSMNREETNSGSERIDAPISLEGKRKLSWMQDTRVRLFIQMKLLACRDELDWMIKGQYYAVNNHPREC